MGVVRDFMGTLEPAEVARLPAQWAPFKFCDAQDVASFAFDMVGMAEDDFHQKVVDFFAKASRRLAQILAPARRSTAAAQRARLES